MPATLQRVLTLKCKTSTPVSAWIRSSTIQATAIIKIPKRAQVKVVWADWTAFGSPPEVRYLNPANITITNKATKANPTDTEMKVLNVFSICCKPAGEGPSIT